MENYKYIKYHGGARVRKRAEQRARQKQHMIAIARQISGIAAFVFFMLILGKAGASDCGVAWEEIFPSTLYYMAAFGLSIAAFNYLDKYR